MVYTSSMRFIDLRNYLMGCGVPRKHATLAIRLARGQDTIYTLTFNREGGDSCMSHRVYRAEFSDIETLANIVKQLDEEL